MISSVEDFGGTFGGWASKARSGVGRWPRVEHHKSDESSILLQGARRPVGPADRAARYGVTSESGTMKSNSDGSVDIYFGPKVPPGKENNWIQTVPSKGWFTLLRLYGALEPWFDKTWRPGEIELVK